MIRANIYSLEPLQPDTREAVLEGIGMTAAYMGETITAKELAVRLPLNEDGRVNPLRVGFSKLDKLVELHVMAVPVDPGESDRMGMAGLGRGWSFVDTSSGNKAIARTTAAHEAAHAFGFIKPGSTHSDPESPYHCCDESCLMHKKALIISRYVEHVEYPGQLDTSKRRKIFKRKQIVVPQAGTIVRETVSVGLEDQFDFCLPCKVNMRDDGAENLAQLRRNRVLSWKGVK